MLVRDKINEIARLLYARMGYMQKMGFDFRASKHPQEIMCFDMAAIAFKEITGDTPDLESEWEE